MRSVRMLVIQFATVDGGQSTESTESAADDAHAGVSQFVKYKFDPFRECGPPAPRFVRLH